MVALRDATTGKEWTGWRDLMAYISEAYHDSLRAALPPLERLTDQVARERLVPIRLSDGLRRLFAALDDSLRTHLAQQEEHLFPMIRHVFGCRDDGGCASGLGDGVEKLMDEAAFEDREVVATVRLIDQFLRETDWARKGPLVAKLVKGLHELRADLEEHIQLETRVLFPAVRELLRGNRQATEWLLRERNKNQTAPFADGTEGRWKTCVVPRPWPPVDLANPSDEIVVADQETG